MRLIDADEFLERFNRKSDVWEALTDEETSNEFWLFCRVADELEKTPTVTMDVNTSPVGGWISVRDRLPEYNGQYIVYMPASVAVIAAYYFKNNGGFFIGESIVTDKVSHWIYLPEPPKEET